MRTWSSKAFVALLWGVAGGCGGTDTAADVDGGGTGADGSSRGGDTGPVADGRTGEGGSGLDGSRESFCAGRGPAVVVGDSSGSEGICAGRLAERTFRFALCSCTDITVPGTLRTDAFDSRTGQSTDAESGAAVGANGRVSAAGGADVGGTLTVSGADEFAVSGTYRVRGDTAAHGAVRVAGTLEVSRDLRTASDVTAPGGITVGRDLVQPAGASRSGDIQVTGDVRTEEVTVPDPCACDASDLLDVPGVVDWGADHNDNAEVDFDPGVAAAVVGEQTVELPCGRFVLSGISVSGDLRFVVAGRTALFVEGDASIAGTLEVEVGPEGELDLFVAGGLTVTGSASFGDPERPSAVRIYVGATDRVSISGGGEFVGNLYAPRAPVMTSGDTEVYGSIFAGDFDSAGSTTIHYDRAILEAGETCGEPPPSTCGGCGECAGGEACVGGTCGPCGSDGDCCAPLSCAGGVCGPLLI